MKKSVTVCVAIVMVFCCSLFPQETTKNCYAIFSTIKSELQTESTQKLLKLEASVLGGFHIVNVASTFFHELGHAAAARSVGCEILKIYVNPLTCSGYCRPGSFPTSSIAKHMYITSCGPAVGMLFTYACGKYALATMKKTNMDLDVPSQGMLLGVYMGSLNSLLVEAWNIIPSKKYANRDGSKIVADVSTYFSKTPYKTIAPRLYYTSAYSLFTVAFLYSVSNICNLCADAVKKNKCLRK